MDVQMQHGSSDCGVFAVAFAATLASGGRPGAIGYCQANMRRHLLNCLDKWTYTLSYATKEEERQQSKGLSNDSSVLLQLSTPGLEGLHHDTVFKMSCLVPCRHLCSSSERSFGIVEEVVMLSLCLNKCCFVTRTEHFSLPCNNEHWTVITYTNTNC